MPPRVVLHLDMDAFYAAIEVREDPSLAGKSVIVGHPGKRGVVTTCSYEARVFGVRSAMPSVVAARLCPDATWLPVRMSLYVEVSRRIRAILDEEAPLVEPLSIDEAFLDLTGWAKSLDAGAAIARKLKDRIRSQERLTASVGVAPNKFLAKLASDLEKPDGLVVLPKEAIPKMLWPLPVERLWGVGPKGADKLRLGGLRTIGDVARTAEDAIASLMGASMARHVKALAGGEDDRAVEHDRASRSISEERTYTDDLRDPREIDRALLARAQGVARQLRREGLVARTVHLKVRAGDFTTWTRARTLREPTDLVDPIVGAARELLASRVRLEGKGVRLLGVGVSGIAPAGARAGSLFPDADTVRAKRIAGAEDAIRAKLGDTAVTRASLVRKKVSGTVSRTRNGA